MSQSIWVLDGETADDILDGRLKVIQKKKGYRFSIDALLLAHFVTVKRGDRILDLGTGSGIIALILACRAPSCRVVGLEIQREAADRARRTLALNGMRDRMGIIAGDVRHIGDLLSPQSFHVAVCNPPYRKLASGRMNPDGEKAQARHEVNGTLDDFLKAAAFALKPGGRVHLIYPARRMVALISRMRANRLEPKRCRLVHSAPGSRGEFVLAEGVAGGREELTIEPPLFIYDQERHYSEDMIAILNDLASSPTTDAVRSPSP